MRTFRSFAVLPAALLAFALSTPAQPPDGSRFAERQLAQMKESLNLTADQEARLKPILEDSAKRTLAVREKHGGAGEGRPSREAMQEMMKVRQETDAKISEVLTAEQKEKFEKQREEMRQRGFGAGKRGGKRGGGRSQ
ncbi:MAG: hypothetical protein IPM24_00640 [Bryobacterales bacterium]|nr:hypothetical protein [Bryobacterales bacterium]